MSSPASTAPRPAVGRRITPWVAFGHGRTMAWRNLIKVITSPELIIFAAMQPLILMFLFLFIFGGAVSGDRGAYLQFLLPGILTQNATFQVVIVGTVINADISKGIFDRFRSLPIARSAPLLGHIIGDLPRSLLASMIVLAIGMAVGFRITTDVLSVLLAIALLLLMAFALSWAAVALGLLVRRAESLNFANMILVFPLAFGGNSLVQTDTLPGWMQAWAKINPMSHLNNALRDLLVGTVHPHAIAWTLLSAAVILVIFVPLAVRAYLRQI